MPHDERRIQEELLERFDRLQGKLVPLWRHIGRSDPGSDRLEAANTVVVVPSLTVDMPFDAPSRQAYEERMLFMLFLLGQPDIRVVYLTSTPVPREIVEYYLDLLPSVVASDARRRLHMVSPGDASGGHLVRKLLDRPRLLQHVRGLIPDLDHAHMVPFLTTDLERELAVRLGIPMYAADPRHFAFGTKSGCRRIFREEGVPHPLGEEGLGGEADVVEAVVGMRARKPGLGAVIVKQNEGVSGFGNAVVDLDGLPAPGDAAEADAVADRVRAMRLELESASYDDYMEGFSRQGGIVEELVTGEVVRSPSAQLRLSPLGDLELLSTHDQILGGPSGQTYLGARFPASPEYAVRIMDEAAKVGRRFAREGIVGRFAVDFLVVKRADGTWDPYAIEVNLRKGGTTHPYLTLQYLTDGRYHADRGVFLTALGHEKHYVATDNLKSPEYRVLTPEDLFGLVSRHRLHFDPTHQAGVVMHMMSAVSSHGRLGLTAVGDTPKDAEATYQRFVSALDRAVAG